MKVIVLYDISDDDVRQEVFQYLESWGVWKQYSVFELELSESEFVDVRAKLESYISGEDASIHVIRLSESTLDNRIIIGDYKDENQTNVV